MTSRTKRQPTYRQALFAFHADGKTAVRPMKEIASGSTWVGGVCTLDVPGFKGQTATILKLSNDTTHLFEWERAYIPQTAFPITDVNQCFRDVSELITRPTGTVTTDDEQLEPPAKKNRVERNAPKAQEPKKKAQPKKTGLLTICGGQAESFYKDSDKIADPDAGKAVFPEGDPHRKSLESHPNVQLSPTHGAPLRQGGAHRHLDFLSGSPQHNEQDFSADFLNPSFLGDLLEDEPNARVIPPTNRPDPMVETLMNIVREQAQALACTTSALEGVHAELQGLRGDISDLKAQMAASQGQALGDQLVQPHTYLAGTPLLATPRVVRPTHPVTPTLTKTPLPSQPNTAPQQDLEQTEAGLLDEVTIRDIHRKSSSDRNFAAGIMRSIFTEEERFKDKVCVSGWAGSAPLSPSGKRINYIYQQVSRFYYLDAAQEKPRQIKLRQAIDKANRRDKQTSMKKRVHRQDCA